MKAQTYFFPETRVGGYSRVDGTVEFYGRVNALLRKEMVVLNFGAGRGAALRDDLSEYRRELQLLRGKAKTVIGVDVDEVVRDNPGLDEAHVIRPDERLPAPDGSVDLVVSDHVFEHVGDPAFVAAELDRVLAPGGWLCARTPNKHGYVALAARLIPDRLHHRVLRRAQPGRKTGDIFPTHYRLNTKSTLRQHFPPERFDGVVYGHFAEPAYFGQNIPAWFTMLTLTRFLPDNLAPSLLAFMQKRATP